MECINERKDSKMKLLTGAFPYILGGVAGAVILYLVQTWNDQPDPNRFPMTTGVEEVTESQMLEEARRGLDTSMPQVELTEESEPEQIYCPEPACPQVQCPEPEVRYKTKVVYKDRVIHVPTAPEPGCYADWSKGKFSGYTTRDMNLRCTFDHQREKVKTHFTLRNGHNGTLRRSGRH